MAETVKHSTLSGPDAHPINRWVVADVANLPSAVVAADLHKIAYVTAQGAYYALTSIDPAPAWLRIPGAPDSTNPVVDIAVVDSTMTVTYKDAASEEIALPEGGGVEPKTVTGIGTSRTIAAADLAASLQATVAATLTIPDALESAIPVGFYCDAVSLAGSITMQATAPQELVSAEGSNVKTKGAGSRVRISRESSTKWVVSGDVLGFVPGGWNIATASYDNISLSIAAQEALPKDLTFSSDGTKMYLIGEGGDAIYQYSLTTAWDLTTATYDTVTLSVSAQDAVPASLAFKSDGLKMYVLGSSGDAVYQYSLTTAWDLSTASYDTVSFSVGTQDAAPQGLAFKPDGTKMYMVGSATDAIYQYSLATAWDLSTASYDTVSFSVATEDQGPYSIGFKPDGWRLFVLGGNNDTVYHYSFGSTWDVSTLSYANKSVSVENQETSPQGLAFKDDGTKMYVVGLSTDTVYQYTLTG